MSDKMDIEKKTPTEEKKNDSNEDKEKKDESESNKIIEYKPPQPTQVVVHPLVLLSVVDHYTRVAKDTNKRVVGVLLGENYKGKVDITNSYAVPFEEDPKDEKIWFIDAQYHQEMYAMFKKVNAKEKVVGWYSTGPKIRPADLEINELFRQYTPHPLLVIIDVNNQKNTLSSTANNSEIPTDAYLSIEANPEEKSLLRRSFIHLSSSIGAYEAEEVGVEFLLRGVRDTLVSTLTDDIEGKINGLKGLRLRLLEIIKYLNVVIEGTIPINHSILYNLQDIFNYLPDIRSHPSSIRSLTIHSNDNYLSLYLSSLIRSILALHDLLNNKLLNREIEKDEQKKIDAEKKKRREEREKAEEKKREEGGIAEGKADIDSNNNENKNNDKMDTGK